jgi:LEA14-like dessication related protein
MPPVLTRRRVVAGLAGGTALSLVGGCASMAPESERPTVHVAGLRAGEIGLFEQQVFVTLRITNPGDRALALSGVSFDLDIDGQAFARGLSGAAVDVPRLGTATVEVEALSSLSKVLGQLRGLARERTDAARPGLRWRLRGRLVRAGGGSIRFDEAGELALDRAAP